MQRWGVTSKGSARFRCRVCKTSSVQHRDDSRQRVYQKLFVRWLTTSTHLNEIAHHNRITCQTLLNRFEHFWSHLPCPHVSKDSPDILVVDGITVVKHALVSLIAVNPHTHKPTSWLFAPRESYQYWIGLFSSLRMSPRYVVCDGQRGLLKALYAVWPEIRIQRCVIHVMRQARAWLTLHPQTRAGRELLILVRTLSSIHTRRQKRRWIRSYRQWVRRHDCFLKERSWHGRRWWYTHRKIRAVRSLLTNSLPHLFTYVGHDRVPRTSNHVEGGINSRIKDLLRIHRGLTPHHQQIMVAWYLATRQGQKPTRNFN